MPYRPVNDYSEEINRAIAAFLRDGPKTSQQVGRGVMWPRSSRALYADAAHGRLVRLAKHGLVRRRDTKPTTWELA